MNVLLAVAVALRCYRFQFDQAPDLTDVDSGPGGDILDREPHLPSVVEEPNYAGAAGRGGQRAGTAPGGYVSHAMNGVDDR